MTGPLGGLKEATSIDIGLRQVRAPSPRHPRPVHGLPGVGALIHVPNEAASTLSVSKTFATDCVRNSAYPGPLVRIWRCSSGAVIPTPGWRQEQNNQIVRLPTDFKGAHLFGPRGTRA